MLNALAAIAVATELGVEDHQIAAALDVFTGVGRRFAQVGDLPVLPASGGGIYTVVDDYGHHPSEMQATLEAARGAWPDRRLVIVFQPHRYTRTRDCFHDFVQVLNQADAVLLTEVYAAGEAPIRAASGSALAQALRVAGQVETQFIPEIAHMPQAIHEFVQNGDVVVLMGAGSISRVATQLKELT